MRNSIGALAAMGVAAMLMAGCHVEENQHGDSKDVKMFAYLRQQMKAGRLETYEALVVDLRNFGFFVDVSALGLSGLVHLSSVEDDFYVFDAERHQLIGRRARRVIRTGDKVTVQVNKVDTFKKQVDFKLARKAAQGVKPAPRPQPQKRRTGWTR